MNPTKEIGGAFLQTMTREEYDNRVHMLLGKVISKVIYYEVDYGDGLFHFFDDPRFDSLDFGLDLVLEEEERFAITWGDEFWQYGISVKPKPLVSVQWTDRMLDVSTCSRWRLVLGKKIRSAEVSWSWCEELGKPETRVYYPQDLLLRFDEGRVMVISALEIREEDRPMGMMDNITVFDDLEMAKTFKCFAET